jgi:hypothetical protein
VPSFVGYGGLSEVKFKDPLQVRCPACGDTSVQSVDDLLGRRATCSWCGRLLAEISEKMHRQRNTWRELVIVGHLAFEIQRQITVIRFDFDKIDFEKVHCLQDLVIVTEALLIDVPEPERHDSAVHAVRSAYRSVFPQFPCPRLAEGLADVFRPHWDSADFWKMACRKLG